MIYVGWYKPYQRNWMNRLELFNEYCILFSCYFLFTYSDGLLNMPNPGWPEYDEQITDEDLKTQVGFFNIGLLAILCFVNLCVMVTVQIGDVYRKLKLRCLKSKQKTMIKEYQE